MKYIFLQSFISLTILVIFVDARSVQHSRGSIKHKDSDLRQYSEPIYGNNIPGHEAQIAHQFFDKQPNGSYKFG